MTNSNPALTQAVAKLKEYEDCEYGELVDAMCVVMTEIDRIRTVMNKISAKFVEDYVLPPDEIEPLRQTILTYSGLVKDYCNALDPAIEYAQDNTPGFVKPVRINH